MKRVVWSTAKILLVSLGVFSVIFLSLGLAILGQIPSDKEIKSCLTTKMYKIRLCPDSGNYVKLGQISPFLQKAVVLTEDSAFWQHNGFDFSEMQKSLEADLKQGRFARGGSTITQQLSKNLFLTEQKSLTRKGLEAIITMRLEKVLSKKEILEKYLNVVHFGEGLFGVKQAAAFYFKKKPSELDLIESAYLAFLLPSPLKYSKSFYKKQLTPFARTRLNQIIDRMYQYDRVSGEDYEAARERLETFLGGAQAPPAPPEIEAIDEESAEPDPAIAE